MLKLIEWNRRATCIDTHQQQHAWINSCVYKCNIGIWCREMPIKTGPNMDWGKQNTHTHTHSHKLLYFSDLIVSENQKLLNTWFVHCNAIFSQKKISQNFWFGITFGTVFIILYATDIGVHHISMCFRLKGIFRGNNNINNDNNKQHSFEHAESKKFEFYVC